MGRGGGGHFLGCCRHKSCRGSGVKLKAPKRYFQHLSCMRYVCEKSTKKKCDLKRKVFSLRTSAYFRGPVNLKHNVYPSTSALNISQYGMIFG